MEKFRVVTCEGGGTENNRCLLMKNCVKTKHCLDTMEPCFDPLAAGTEMGDHQGGDTWRRMEPSFPEA